MPKKGDGGGGGAKPGHGSAGPASTSTTVTKAETTLAKEVGETAVDVASKPTLYAKVAARIGLEVLDGLVPDPIDALELLYDVANAYEEARNEIKQRRLTDGFAIGFAAYLVIPRWEWASWFAYKAVVHYDVTTQILSAVGLAENAFNEGLVRGFLYGERHSKAQANTVRQAAFDALVKAERMPGRYLGDDVYQFGRGDVFTFAAVLRPTSLAALREAERRQADQYNMRELEKAMRREREQDRRRQPRVWTVEDTRNAEKEIERSREIDRLRREGLVR